MTQTPHTEQPRPPRGRGLVQRTVLDSLYALTAFPIGLASFVVVVVGLSFGLSLAILWVGIPVLVATVLAAQGFARLERVRLVALQGRAVDAPTYRRADPADPAWKRTLNPLRDAQNWLDALWSVLALVTSTVAFSVVVTWWCAVAGGLTYWFWQQWLPEVDNSLAEVLGMGSGRTPEIVLNTGFGLLALVTLPWAMRWAAWVHASLADVLLNWRGDLTAQVEQERGARAAAQQAEAASFRRLERDIHDGPQQRLVRLTMDLGRAKRQLGTDPELAAATVDEALVQARATLDELRALSRGIAPPLLVDRGLGVALDELVVRSAVPVEMHHALPVGLSPHVETAVYFTVSEALTNVAKHSGASAARVRVAAEGDTLTLEVSDDGVGGAHLSKGRGLAGLEQRLAAVGGTFHVDSPAGGPTVLTARIPRA